MKIWHKIALVYIFILGLNCSTQAQTSMEDKIKASELNMQGIQLLQQKRNESAREYFQKAADTDPSTGEYPNNVGVTYLNDGKLELALKYFTKASEVEPSLPRPFYNLGVVYQALREDEKAATSYEKAVSLSPNAESYFNLGIVYSRLGNKTKAIQSYEKFINIAPKEYVGPIKDAKEKIAALKKG
ncbi:tetratricopeptide repeat protein [Leptospira sarikeiensis]|uniref:Tetratricopeptide repeat protein n=1 Tax=Leptospira sarikeiensis TaxID=2484943 RepID=A0A4R9KDL6_9LEPT|nr:tetratricopeptide repeat protein [Leptospira sarikeiensis]TGL64211.1 tetratricopeptide repeat protein [Leptospira sarikeiensis]